MNDVDWHHQRGEHGGKHNGCDDRAKKDAASAKDSSSCAPDAGASERPADEEPETFAFNASAPPFAPESSQTCSEAALFTAIGLGNHAPDVHS